MTTMKKEIKDKQLSVRMSETTLNQITHISKVLNTNRNNTFNRALAEYIANNYNLLAVKVEDEEVQ